VTTLPGAHLEQLLQLMPGGSCQQHPNADKTINLLLLLPSVADHTNMLQHQRMT
jgi:hypothetical protein